MSKKLSKKFSIKCLAIALLFGAACGQPDSHALDTWGAASTQGNGDELNGSVFNGVMLNGVMLNGVMLNGVMLNGVMLNGVMLNGVMLNGVMLNGVMLTATTTEGATLSGTDIIGLTLKGGLSNNGTADLRIDAVSHDSATNVYWYKVSESLDGGNSWNQYCADGSSALILRNRWDGRSGDLIADPSAFTFACDNAALAKCRKWGYDPDSTRNECDGRGNCKDQSVQMWHQSCTRMVRADYCGDGVSHTRNGTLIDIYDSLNIQTRDGNVGTIEADWSANGAHCIRKTRFLNASGQDSDYNYVLNHCSDRLAAEDASCGGDPNTGPDITSYSAANGYSVDPAVRHLLRNDSVGNLQ